ncbi:MAG: response regulator transcription factor [Bacteroidota bacterium]
MAELRILYLEDEPLLARVVKDSLESRGLAVDWYEHERAARSALHAPDEYDLALLDVQLPGRDGFEIGADLRTKAPDLPIIYLTARIQAKDALKGFASGADDYIRKPFSLEELLVRIERMVELKGRKAEAPEPDTFRLGQLTFDYRSLRLLKGSTVIQELSNREAELLKLFALAGHGKSLDRKAILLEIWEDDSFFHSRNLDVYIRKLRAYLQADPEVQIITLRGVGYRFVCPNSAED